MTTGRQYHKNMESTSFGLGQNWAQVLTMTTYQLDG